MHGDDLINKLKQHDQEAFKFLVDQYRDKIVNTCLGLVHNPDDAQDVAQEVFMEAYRSIGNFRGDSKPGTWLYRIAVTRSLNFIRNNKKRHYFEPEDGLFIAIFRFLFSFFLSLWMNDLGLFLWDH